MVAKVIFFVVLSAMRINNAIIDPTEAKVDNVGFIIEGDETIFVVN
jgi:hypothetical protein